MWTPRGRGLSPHPEASDALQAVFLAWILRGFQCVPFIHNTFIRITFICSLRLFVRPSISFQVGRSW